MPHASAAHASNDPTTRAAEPGKVVKTVKRHGATFAIDRPIGHVKTGMGFDGKPFELTYSCDYGYLQKTHEDKAPPVGGDGMMVDAYCCEPTSKDAGSGDGDEVIHVVNQVRYGTNEHDEQKLILGARDADHASQVYFTHTPARCFGSMFTMSGDAFRAQLATATPGKAFTFLPSAPIAPDEPPPSSRSARALRNVIPPRAASATVHAHQEPHAMPRTTVVVAAPGPDHAHALQRDAGALDAGGEPGVIPDLFMRVADTGQSFIKKIGDKDRICTPVIMSTEAKDSHRTILRCNWDTKRYESNNVFLWMHNRREDRPPIGSVIDVKTDKAAKQLRGLIVHDDTTEFDREIAAKYQNGTLHGVSVGFNPRTITVEIIDGEETVVFDDIELLELSGACVPSNPQTIAAQMKRCLEIGRAASTDAYPITRGAVPHRKYPLDQSMKWDEKAAEKAVRAWATVGGKLNLGRYAQAFGYVDPDKTDTPAGYALLHHTVSPDGKTLVTVRGGVVAACRDVQTSRVKIPIADMSAVKAHLGEHCKEFGLAPPWEKKKAHDPSLPTPTENAPMLDLIVRLADTTPTGDVATQGRAHGAAPCEVTCPGCSETLRVVAELPASVAKTAAELTETRVTLSAAEARATALETKLGVRSRDVAGLLLQIAERDISDLIGKQLDPAERETEIELARVYFESDARDDKGNLVGLAKWQARVEKLKARPDQKLGVRVVPAPKAGDVPTQPATKVEVERDKDGRTHAGEGALSRIADRS